MNPIPPNVKKLWDQWNLRGFMLLSLWLQTFLVLFAPFRKRSASKLVILTNWSAYLLADWAANFAVGLISNSDNQDVKTGGAVRNEELLAFWAPFLILHLGGPDTITAFALEDNELWIRHLFGLFFQVIAAIYVFIQTVPGNRLTVHAILMILAGMIKYGERTRSLYLASIGGFRESMLKKPDPGPNYAKLMEEYSSKIESNLPTKIIIIAEPESKLGSKLNPRQKALEDNVKIVQEAFRLFKTFKGLIVDLIFSFRERNQSREFFLRRTSDDAFGIIEVELSSFYEVLYTKSVVVHKKVGYFFRFLASALVITALFLFHNKTSKKGFNRFDLGITYTLLFGAIALDVIALFMLIFSDRTAANLTNPEDGKTSCKFIRDIINSFLDLKKPKWTEPSEKICRDKTYWKFHVLATPTLFRRWSESISGHNLIAYCNKKQCKSIHTNNGFTGFSCVDPLFRLIELILNSIPYCFNAIINLCTWIWDSIINFLKEIPYLRRPVDLVLDIWSKLLDWVIDFLGIGDLLVELIYKYKVPLTKELWVFIFEQLWNKSLISDDPETSRKICSARGEWILRESDEETSPLMPFVEEVDFDESILLWHVATKLCESFEEDVNEKIEESEEERQKFKYYCKTISDYMLYLLVMQPTMMSAVAGIGQIRYRDTCAEAKKLFERRGVKKRDEGDACRNILDVNTDVKPIDVKGDRSKSVLFDASILAKELKKLKKDKWKVMCGVWVEILAYAASHCRPNTHAQQVSKGGELLSFVWLLMAHLGLGEQFQINEGHARAKLIVGK